MKHFESEIILYIDNELSIEQQKQLFLHLSECEECAIILSDYIKMKNETRNFYYSLDSRFKNIKTFTIPLDKNYKHNYPFYFTAAAVIILGLLFLFQLNNEKKSEMKLSELHNQFISLREDYESILKENENKIILNNDEQTVYKKQEKKEQEGKIFNRKISDKKEDGNLVLKVNPKESEYMKYLNSLPTEKISKNDFLVQQIIGN